MQWCWDISHVTEDPVTGHRVVLSVIDMHSKYAWHFPLMTETADEVGLYLQHLCATEGHPEQGLTDNGCHFTSVEAQRTLTSLGIKIAHGRPYKPTTQGADERLHQSVAVKLRDIAERGNGQWSHSVDLVNYQYNTRHHSSIGMTPYEAHRGEKPRPMGHSGGTIEFDEAAAMRSSKQRAADIQRQVHSKLLKRGLQMQTKHASRYNINFKELLVGSVVRIKAEAPHTVHPWRVLGEVKHVYSTEYTYDVRLLTNGYDANLEPRGTLLKRVPHRRLMYTFRCVADATAVLEASQAEHSPQLSTTNDADMNESLIYEVEVVAGKIPGDDGGYEYWVKWKNYPWTASTFEPLSNFTADVAAVLPHVHLSVLQTKPTSAELRLLDVELRAASSALTASRKRSRGGSVKYALPSLPEGACYVSDLPCAPHSLANDRSPLPCTPSNKDQSCHLDSILMCLWALWRRNALVAGNSGALWKQLFDYVASHMTSGLLTQQDVDYHRDQIWTVLEDRGLTVRPGESGNVNDVLGFVLSRIGTHAQAANFETTYTVVCSCANCGHSSELPRQSETCFEADTDPALATGVDRLSATLYGVSTTQECPSCEQPKMMTFRNSFRFNRVLTVCNVEAYFQDLTNQWPVQLEVDGVRLKLAAAILYLHNHYLVVFKEIHKEWAVCATTFMEYRETRGKILQSCFIEIETSHEKVTCIDVRLYFMYLSRLLLLQSNAFGITCKNTEDSHRHQHHRVSRRYFQRRASRMDPQAVPSEQCPHLGCVIQIKKGTEAILGDAGSLAHGR